MGGKEAGTGMATNSQILSGARSCLEFYLPIIADCESIEYHSRIVRRSLFPDFTFLANSLYHDAILLTPSACPIYFRFSEKLPTLIDQCLCLFRFSKVKLEDISNDYHFVLAFVEENQLERRNRKTSLPRAIIEICLLMECLLGWRVSGYRRSIIFLTAL